MLFLTALAIAREVERATEKFPGNRRRFAALIEEVGELGMALVINDKKAIREEAIQVAACAARIAETFDDQSYRNSLFAEAVIELGACARQLLQRRHPDEVQERWASIVTLAESAMREPQDKAFLDVSDEEAQP